MKSKPLVSGFLILCLGILMTALTPASDLAFTNVDIGEELPELKLTHLSGGVEDYLGTKKGQFSVFAFIKVDQTRSEHLINQWNELRSAFAEKPVHWALIVSDRHDTGQVAHWDSLAPGATILVDSGDQLYGLLGVALSPTVAIVDQRGLLQAYLPYRKINYPTIIAAHLRLLMGTISEQEFQQIIEPSSRVSDSIEAGAKRKLKLARMLLKRGRLEPALKQVESALADCPELRDGYLLLAEIHTAAVKPDEASRAIAMANQLSVAIVDSVGVSGADSLSSPQASNPSD